MFNGYDFIYNGKSSISENVKILSTENNTFEFVKSVPDKEFNMFKTNQSGKWRMAGVTTPEPLSFPMQIMIYSDDNDLYADGGPVLERNRISNIAHWLFDTTDFKKFQILSDDLRDLYFMTVFKDIEYFEAGGDVCGFKVTAVCDTIGAYEEKTVKKTSSGSLTFNLQILQDGIYEVQPKFIIDLAESGATINVNGEELILQSLTPGSRITIDSDTLIATSSEGDNLYVENRFNKVFPNFVWGRNTISVTGRCTLTINYKMIREVGC